MHRDLHALLRIPILTPVCFFSAAVTSIPFPGTSVRPSLFSSSTGGSLLPPILPGSLKAGTRELQRKVTVPECGAAVSSPCSALSYSRAENMSSPSIQLCRPWATYLPSRCLSFLTCQVGMIIRHVVIVKIN